MKTLCPPESESVDRLNRRAWLGRGPLYAAIAARAWAGIGVGLQWSAAAGLSLAASGRAAAAAEPAVAPVRWPPVQLLDGQRWAAEPGRAQVVVFWSMTCPFCLRHNEHVQKLHRALAREGGPQLLTVCRDRDGAAVRRHLSARGQSFAVTLEHEALRAALAARKMVPLTVVIDRRGQIRQSIPGEMFEEDLLELQHKGWS